MEENKSSVAAMVLGVAGGIMQNQADEATAVKGYTALLDEMARALEAIEGTPDAEESRSAIEAAIDAVQEIISDELNHQELLRRHYSAITGIAAAKD